MRTRTERSEPNPQSVTSSFLQAATSGGGEALPTTVRDALEPRFQHNFANVRIHADEHAAQASQELGANAFTFGEDIVFGGGRFQPETPVGMRLIAHELTHTMQQGPTPGRLPDALEVASSSSAMESSARSSAHSVLGGGRAGNVGHSAPAVQCELEGEEEEQADAGPFAVAPLLPAAQEAAPPEPSSADLDSAGAEQIETPEERRKRIAKEDKPLEQDMLDDLVQGLPGGLVAGGLSAGVNGMVRAVSGATRGPILKGALSVLEEYNPFSAKNVADKAQRLRRRAGVPD